MWRTPMTEVGQLQIEIANCGGAVCGTIVGARNPQGLAGDYEHMGRQMIWDMVSNGAGSWRDGKIWDPRNDRTYNSRMVLEGGRLNVSGCFLGFCQSQSWERAQ